MPGDALVYSAAEVAERLKVSKAHVHRMANAGVLPCRRLGRRVVFPKVAVDAWLRGAA